MRPKISLSILNHIEKFAQQNPEQEICGVIANVDKKKNS